MREVTISVNGRPVTAEIDERTLLVDFVRRTAQLTGTKAGCLEARCGSCSVHVDGRLIKACNVLALQCDGTSVTTVEGLTGNSAETTEVSLAHIVGVQEEPELTPLQKSFHKHGALQCGYCTPGMLMCLTDLLARCEGPSEEDVRRGLTGNLCRCTGYQTIVDATLAVAQADAQE
ncbi:(2Fe-2S)-binding protein [Arthrobacter sp. Rue61a]|uniref:Quinaldine 4-oxidase small subunit n=1 Tax=Paenarthrobacter ilicis TaxID=43665 RepID=Q7WSQ3_9MICC|nr:(2Fe-2S)-binding protein [Arthrobacter sp. Rue61a]AFR34513.1 quinaldine-4-oxidase, small subunit MeqA [Arthrobacter sp. Rue61a]CAD61047.1 quinaldine 4-oxidase small subunit [Paenarthrobacter ilicis]